MTKAFVKSIKDVQSVCPPLHENADAFPLVTPKLGGSDAIEFFVTEMRPGGVALEDIHETADHVYHFMSGRGYSIVEGDRFDFGPGDTLFIPRNHKHELHVVGTETLRFVVTFSPAR